MEENKLELNLLSKIFNIKNESIINEDFLSVITVVDKRNKFFLTIGNRRIRIEYFKRIGQGYPPYSSCGYRYFKV